MLENGQAMAQEYRQIASTIKDIKDIQGIKSDLDAEEQRARIDNLRQQKNKESNSNNIEIKISGGDPAWRK